MVMVAGDDAQFHELGVRQKVERHEIGTGFFDDEYCSPRSRCGGSVTPGAIRPEPWPMISCMAVVSSCAKPPHFLARSASSPLHENSTLIASGVERSYASLTLASETDLLPYFSRMA